MRIRNLFRFVAPLIAILLAAPPFASAVPRTQSVPIYIDWTTQGTSLLYCHVSDEKPGVGAISATASTTTTVLPAGSYSVVQDEDIIYVRRPNGTRDVRVIKTYSSTSSVVVSASWTLASNTWSFRTYANNGDFSGCGTTATDGWIPLPPGISTVIVNVNTLGSTSVDYSVEGDMGTYGNGLSSVYVIGAASIATATTARIPIVDGFPRIRVGLKHTGAGTNVVNVVLVTNTTI